MKNKDKAKFWQHIRITAKREGYFDKKAYVKTAIVLIGLAKKS